MPSPALRTPSYRLHKPTGQAVVTLSGRDVYLGRHGTRESRAEYDRVVAEWLANGRSLAASGGNAPADLSVSELIAAYLSRCDGNYRKDGEPTSETRNIGFALGYLRRLYGPSPAREFGPLALKAVRASMVAAGLCRNECNKQTGRIVRCFKWAVENEMVPPSLHHALKAVAGLRRGRSEARESEPFRPVPDAFVAAVMPHVAPQIAAMIRLQELTGCRPGEVCVMRSYDLETSGRVWAYRPGSHKTEHHGRDRVIYLGPRAQEVVRPWLKPGLASYLFSPRDVLEARRAARKTPMTPSQKARPRRQPGECYTTRSYYYAIQAGCRRAGVPGWHPHQLRHNAATRLRKEFGLEVARVILGHASLVVTELYAEADQEQAIGTMAQVG